MKCTICDGTGRTGLMAAGGPQLCGVCKGTGEIRVFSIDAPPAPVIFVSASSGENGFVAIDIRGRVWCAAPEGTVRSMVLGERQQSLGGWRWELVPSPTEPEGA